MRDDAQAPVFGKPHPPIPHSVNVQLRRREESSQRQEKRVKGGTHITARSMRLKARSSDLHFALGARGAAALKDVSRPSDLDCWIAHGMLLLP
jgi:hypothetical protein